MEGQQHSPESVLDIVAEGMGPRQRSSLAITGARLRIVSRGGFEGSIRIKA